jgi:hypothetical protein
LKGLFGDGPNVMRGLLYLLLIWQYQTDPPSQALCPKATSECLRCKPSHQDPPLTSRITKWVLPSHLLEGIRPMQSGGMWLALVANGIENCVKHLIYSARSEQPKISNCVSVVL